MNEIKKTRLFKDFYSEWFKLWPNFDQKERKNVSFTTGRNFLITAEYFGQSGRIILERVGNTVYGWAPRRHRYHCLPHLQRWRSPVKCTLHPTAPPSARPPTHSMPTPQSCWLRQLATPRLFQPFHPVTTSSCSLPFSRQHTPSPSSSISYTGRPSFVATIAEASHPHTPLRTRVVLPEAFPHFCACLLSRFCPSCPSWHAAKANQASQPKHPSGRPQRLPSLNPVAPVFVPAAAMPPPPALAPLLAPAAEWWDFTAKPAIVVLCRLPGYSPFPTTPPVAEFINPWLGDKVNSGIGLSYRQGSMNSDTGLQGPGTGTRKQADKILWKLQEYPPFKKLW